jgi:DnaA-like protein
VSFYDRKLKIVKAVAEYYGCSIEELTGPRTYVRVVHARNRALWLMREDGASLLEIARFVNRDHSAVKRALDRMSAGDVPAELRDRIKGIEGSCETCRGLREELAAAHAEISLLRGRFGGSC